MDQLLEEEYLRACSMNLQALDAYDTLQVEVARAKRQADKALGIKDKLLAELNRPNGISEHDTATHNTIKSKEMSGLFRQSYSLNLEAADKIANAAIKAVSHLKIFKPMCVTVLDSNGGVLVQKRMDGCPDGAYRQFSFAKARTCIHLQTSSRSFREKYTGSGEAPKFTQAGAMVSVMDGELIPVAGGVLVQSADGATVGAVGVSGAAADEDEYLAWEGVQALKTEAGVTTVPANHCCTTLQGM